MFNHSLKDEIGLPRFFTGDKDKDARKFKDQVSWEADDVAADKSVNQRLPFIAQPPYLKNPQSNQVQQRRWRLYRRSIPLSMALKNDRSLAILGQIHTVHTHMQRYLSQASTCQRQSR
ncbi:hypothetical protein F5884DRAFT_150560 [Xylogone sp. PMI_703]|nr:hypothetical protein F5884DRAFT_150560 [Xylogone sp. PMI_703]